MKVLIEFNTNEDVTPNWLAQRVAEACTRYGAIRPGEYLRAVEGEVSAVYTTFEQEKISKALDEYAEIIRNLGKPQ